jgi:hypothetical protein
VGLSGLWVLTKGRGVKIRWRVWALVFLKIPTPSHSW